MNFKKRVGFFSLGIAVLLSACVWPEKEDPFARLPNEPMQALEGTIFPFSVSVSTRATHRLEKDEKLQAYLASQIIDLSDFEGQEVEVKGVIRSEKMREIFWVESVEIQNLPDEKTFVFEQEALFEGKNIAFEYPSNWEYTTAPNATAYFLDNNDPTRRVFFTFAVEPIGSPESMSQPNIMIANMAGVKTVSKDENQKEREVVTLFSSRQPNQYVFTFTNPFEDFGRKKAFSQLLNSFVEGEAAVRSLKEARQKAAAKAQVERLKNTLTSDLEDTSGQNTETTDAGDDHQKDTSLKEVTSSITTGNHYESLLDDRAYDYTSNHYGLSLKIPYGFWFQNFGPSPQALMEMGVANNPLSGKSDVDFWIRIVQGVSVSTLKESKTADGIKILAPRNDQSAIEISGPQYFRDAMWSVAESLQ
jgi:hypothetical protein